MTDERERDRLDVSAFGCDEDPAIMRGQRGYNVLMLKCAADVIACAVELDPSPAVHLADIRDAALGDRGGQGSLSFPKILQRKALRQMPKRRPEPVSKQVREASAVLRPIEAPAGLLKMVIVQEATAVTAQGVKVGAGMPQDALLPEAIEALDAGVASGFASGNKKQVNAQQKMQADDLGEAIMIVASSMGGHLVVHLGDDRNAHILPAVNKMPAQREGLLVGILRGRGGLSDRVNGHLIFALCDHRKLTPRPMFRTLRHRAL